MRRFDEHLRLQLCGLHMPFRPVYADAAAAATDAAATTAGPAIAAFAAAVAAAARPATVSAVSSLAPVEHHLLCRLLPGGSQLAAEL